jgi:hypothetical protein
VQKYMKKLMPFVQNYKVGQINERAWARLVPWKGSGVEGATCPLLHFNTVPHFGREPRK